MNVDAERTSGIISLGALDLLLLVFIFTFNFEQFVEIRKIQYQLSAETQERVNAVILTIIMAIVVILFYFKGSYNFDKKAKLLAIMAKIWIFLNVVLILSAAAKNSEYIVKLGLTYKRLGVYCFLLLSVLGLITTFIKIQKKRSNAFIFNQMIWLFFRTVLVNSFLNWGAIITDYNLKRADFDVTFHETQINFNDKHLLEYAARQKNEVLKNNTEDSAVIHKNSSLLSTILYYKTIPVR